MSPGLEQVLVVVALVAFGMGLYRAGVERERIRSCNAAAPASGSARVTDQEADAPVSILTVETVLPDVSGSAVIHFLKDDDDGEIHHLRFPVLGWMVYRPIRLNLDPDESPIHMPATAIGPEGCMDGKVHCVELRASGQAYAWYFPLNERYFSDFAGAESFAQVVFAEVEREEAGKMATVVAALDAADSALARRGWQSKADPADGAG
jgi:hypothetical protein